MIDVLDLKNELMKIDREFVCEAFASVIVQLFEHGVKFLDTPDAPDLVEYYDENGIKRSIKGLLPEAPAKNYVQLDFDGFRK